MATKLFQCFLNVVLLGCVVASGSGFAENTESAKSAVAVAIFAGGCFWCMEPPFDAISGVISTTSGYTGGHTENPTYEQVSNGNTGHLEAVQVLYDPGKVSYETLLNVFWRNIDPFDGEGQFCDKGDQYKAVIFYQNENEKQLAEASKKEIQHKMADKNSVTTIRPAGKFFPAEDYHQDYYLKNPTRYKFYRFTCGRDHRLSQVWGK